MRGLTSKVLMGVSVTACLTSFGYLVYRAAIDEERVNLEASDRAIRAGTYSWRDVCDEGAMIGVIFSAGAILVPYLINKDKSKQ